MVAKEIDSVAWLASRYDVFFVDQFGVLHNGYQEYPGSAETLRQLKQAGKQVLLIGNSGKRAWVNEQRLTGLGFERSCYDHFVSSGEVGWQQLADRRAGRSDVRKNSESRRCLFISRDADRSAIEGLGFALTENGSTADVILISGCRDDITAIAYYEDLLIGAAERSVPCFCTNPDKIALTRTGTKFGAGAIAQAYEAMGGQVTWIGKPYPEIYQFALSKLSDPANHRIVCIGDSVEHDIAGGHRAGLSTALVQTGILADLEPAEMNAVYARHEVVPDFVLPGFRWN